MYRGDVYVADVWLPDRSATAQPEDLEQQRKFVVILNDVLVTAGTTEVAVVIASTYLGWPLRPFEVLFDTPQGFSRETIVDCRWPYTFKQELVLSGQYRLTLGVPEMHRIALALVKGLQLS